MILPIAINFNKNLFLVQFKQNCLKKNDYGSYDIFERQQKATPSFGAIIPQDRIFKICDTFMKKVNLATDPTRMRDLTKKFYEFKLLNILKDNPDLSYIKREFLGDFRHELVNLISYNIKSVYDEEIYDVVKKNNLIANEQQFLGFQKNTVSKIVDDIKIVTFYWRNTEVWSDKVKKIVDIKNVFIKLNNNFKLSERSDIKFLNKKLLKDKKVLDPLRLYILLSNAVSNAIKYGEGKPILVRFSEELIDGKKYYYALIENVGTKVISDSDIDKLLKRKIERTQSAIDSGIEGTGQGLRRTILTLDMSGYNKDIKTLIEKGRQSGVCVKIPLIGVQ